MIRRTYKCDLCGSEWTTGDDAIKNLVGFEWKSTERGQRLTGGLNPLSVERHVCRGCINEIAAMAARMGLKEPEDKR